ncbi:MAG: hypothetical protein AAB794_03800 [Patescibacteria group bacterium]
MEDLDKTMTGKPKRDWWKQGKALDLWSIPHFLFGILMGMLPPLIGISLLTALSLTLILALLWELYEKLVEIKETFLNSVFDVILPIVAFTCISLVFHFYSFHPNDILVVAIAIFVLYVFTNLSGWLAYRRRKHDFYMH